MALAGGPADIVLAVLAAIAIHFAFKFINNGIFFKPTQSKISKARAAERIKLKLAKMEGGDKAYADYITSATRNLGIPKERLEQLSNDYIAERLSEVMLQQEKGDLPSESIDAALTASIETDIAQGRAKHAAAKSALFTGPQLREVPVSERAAFLGEMQDQLFSPQQLNGRNVVPKWNDKARQKIQQRVRSGA